MDANWGQAGMVLLSLDPAIVDENDPKKVDPTLDLFNPANGYRKPPEASKYSEEFLARYRQGSLLVWREGLRHDLARVLRCGFRLTSR